MNFSNDEKRVQNAETLEALFDLWKQAHACEENYEKTTVTETAVLKGKKFGGIDQNAFISDGYIGKTSYENAKTKILFILKEANVQAYRGEDAIKNPSGDTQVNFYMKYIEGTDKPNRPKQQEKLGRIANYILTNSDSKADDDIRQAMKQCAFMNVNKRGGGNADKKVNAYIKQYKAFVKREIEILNPDICVVIGKTMNAGLFMPQNMPYITLHHTADHYHNVYSVDKYMNHFLEIYRSFKQEA